jgi:leucyl aminopeptidase
MLPLRLNTLCLLAVALISMLQITRSFKLGRSLTYKSIFRSSSLSASVTSPYTSSDTVSLDVNAGAMTSFSGDLLVVPLHRPSKSTEPGKVGSEIKASIPSCLQPDIVSIISDIIDEGNFKAEIQSKVVVRIMNKDMPNVKYLALVGLGLNAKKDSDFEVPIALKLGRTLAAVAKETNAKSMGLIAPSIGSSGLTQIFLGIHDAVYNDNRFKKVPEGGHEALKLKSFTILEVDPSVAEKASLVYKLTSSITSGVDFAKDLVGAPSNSKTPEVIASLAIGIAKDYKFECKILNKKECEELNMGGYLGVQQGSKFEPQFIHLCYKPDKPSDDVVKIALIGKGLTFDSGGYNLKAGPGSMIELMKFDMGGCAAVLGTAKAIGQLRPRVSSIAILD